MLEDEGQASDAEDIKQADTANVRGTAIKCYALNVI